MTEPRFPHFIIIGAVKAATTWIALQLRHDPSIFLPKPEPHFFSTEYSRGTRWYADLFAAAPAGCTIGEKSADYLADPDAARRMRELLPSVRLIAQLRNPVERAYSDYCMLFRRGAVDADLERYLTHRNAANSRFLKDGLYAGHLSRFLDHFPREQLLVILYDDINSHPQAAIADVCCHIGAQIRIDPVALAERKNDSQTPLLPLPLRRALKPFKSVVAPVRGQAWFQAAHRTLARSVRYPPLTDDLRRRLCDFYTADVQKLERLLGRDLQQWMIADVRERASA